MTALQNGHHPVGVRVCRPTPNKQHKCDVCIGGDIIMRSRSSISYLHGNVNWQRLQWPRRDCAPGGVSPISSFTKATRRISRSHAAECGLGTSSLARRLVRSFGFWYASTAVLLCCCIRELNHTYDLLAAVCCTKQCTRRRDRRVCAACIYCGIY